MFTPAIKTFSLIFTAISSFANAIPKKALVTSSLDPSWYSGGRWCSIDTSFTSNGIENIVKGKDSVGGNSWNQNVNIPNNVSGAPSFVSNCFDVSGDNEVTINFTVAMFDKNGQTLSKAVNDPYDRLYIEVINDLNNNVVERLRISTSDGDGLASSHAYQIIEGNSWPSEGNGKINGAASEDSSFTLNFSRAYGLRSYVNDGDTLETLDNPNYDVKSAIESGTFEELSKIRFDIHGDNGFDVSTKVILNSINNQSFANGPSVDDNVAPNIYLKSSINSTLILNEPYTLPLGVTDPVSNSYISLTSDDGDINGLTFTPNKLGNVSVKAISSDDYGNSSEKIYSFEVVSSISAPTIVSLPTIEGGLIEPLSTLYFDSPIYEDESGSTKVSLSIVSKDDPNNKYELAINPNGKFSLYIDKDFKSGTYIFTYTLSNEGGVTISSPIEVTYELDLKPVPEYVTSDTSMLIDYVDEGIRVRSDGNYRNALFTNFDLAQGVDVTYTIPINMSNGDKNKFNYLDLKLINETNSSYQLWYRIWIDGKETNDSSPTNVYVFIPGQETIDISNCGWLSRDIDGIDGKFHMAFSYDNYFQGEFREDIKSALGVDEYLDDFFAKAPSSLYSIAFSAAGIDTSGKQSVEFVINSLNKQSFANEDGVISKYRKPTLDIDIPNPTFEANKEVSISYYAKNILEKETLVTASLYEDEILIYSQTSLTNEIKLTFPKSGLFTLVFSIDYGEEKQVSKSFDIEVRSIIQDLEITIDGDYLESYLPGDKLTILSATYSSNVILEKTSISLVYPSGDIEEVSSGDEINLEHAGIYEVIYYACDDASPNVNETRLSKYIKVLDIDDPIISLSINGDLTLGSIINIRVNISDDSDTDCYIFLTDTNGDRTIYQSSNVNFNPTNLGEYKIDVHVEDIYGNISSLSRSIEITKPTLSKTSISWIVIGSVLFVLMVGFIGLVVVNKARGN